MMTGTAQTFGAFVKAARTEKKLYQREVSVKAGITDSHLSRIEKGEREPTLEVALNICKALGVDINEFIRQYQNT